MTIPQMQPEKPLIQCPICGCRFEKGAKTACQRCVLHYGDCGFEKCPNCGFDVPSSSKVWDFMVKMKQKWQDYHNERKQKNSDKS